MNNVILWLILIILAPSCIFAAPSKPVVSGTVSHGSAVTVSGTSFGTHANYNEGSYTWQSASPLAAKFKDFNDSSKTSGGWYDAFPAQNSIVTGGRISGGKYLKEQYVSDERTQVQYDMANSSGEFYISFWFLLENNTQAGKFWRVYGTGSAANVYLTTGCSNNLVRGYSECTDTECSPETEWGTGTEFTPGTWQRFEIYMSQASNTFTVYMDGVQQWTKNDWVGNPFGGNGHSMDFGNMIDSPGAGRCSAHPTWDGSHNYDDIFVNYTRARVELCTGSTWASKGTCEVQIPTAWGASSISLKSNTGPLASSSTVYLYVVDSSGAVSPASDPITIDGGGSDFTAPSTTISTTDPSSITTDSLTVVGTASDAVGVSGCKWRVGYVPDANNGVACTWTPGTSSFSCSPTYGYSTGANNLYVGCSDAVGNYGSDSIVVNYSGGDITPPTLSAGTPTGSLPAGTTSVSMTVTTNENATCRFSTTSGTSYASIGNTFSTTGGTSHSVTITGLENGGSYNQYVRCMDGAGNANNTDYVINWSVAVAIGPANWGSVLIGIPQ